MSWLTTHRIDVRLAAMVFFLAPVLSAQSVTSGLHLYVSQTDPFVAGEEGSYSGADQAAGAGN